MKKTQININTHNCVNTLKSEKNIKLANYYGCWSVIDDYRGFVLLEHNEYGDETCYLVVKASDFEWKEFIKKSTGEKVLLPYFSDKCSVYETYDDIVTCLEDYEVL